VLLVVDAPRQVGDVVTHLIRVGFDDVQGYVEGGIEAWETAGYPLTTLPTMSVHDLHDRIKRSKSDVVVLDVRTEQEWEAGHIEDAVHIHGGVLQDRFDDVPRERPVAVVCGSGYRASIAASFLQRQGYQDVTNVIGGMSAWKAAGLPTVT
jgi:hydroxyacylglutathione hydrolase